MLLSQAVMTTIFLTTITFEKLFWPNNAFGVHRSVLATILINSFGEDGHGNIGLFERVYSVNDNMINRSHFITALFRFAQ